MNHYWVEVTYVIPIEAADDTEATDKAISIIDKGEQFADDINIIDMEEGEWQPEFADKWI